MEIWDLYNELREVTGKEHIRGEEIPEGYYHLVVHVWIKNKKGEYLISQRSEDRPAFPLMWECVGGSALKGEDSYDWYNRDRMAQNIQMNLFFSESCNKTDSSSVYRVKAEENSLSSMYTEEYKMNMNIIKKTAAFALAGTMILSLAACGSANNSQTDSASAVQTETTQEIKDNSLGGWEVNSGSLSVESNAAAKAAFEKATEGMEGYEYEPIALLGTQVVAGTNYSILVRGTAVIPDAIPSYEIITIYEDLEGNAEILGEKTLIGGDNEEAVGAFTANDGEYDLSKNADVKAVFDKAFEMLDGSEYETIAYLGSQVVQGTNYLALVRITPVVPDAESEIALVTVYEDLEGNTEMLETERVSLDAEGDASSAENVQIPDPFEGFSTLEEATSAVGFEMSVPDATDGYKTVLYRVDADIHMLEVIYSDKELENEDAVEAYRIRKAVGSDDISGDYNKYNEENVVSVSGNQVTLKGNDGKVFVAIWTSGEYTYAIDIDMNGQGLSRDDVIVLVNATK